MHRLILLVLWMFLQTSAVEFDMEIATSSVSVSIEVKSNGECCCQYNLQFYLNLTNASSSCGEDQNCSNCKSFKITKLWPLTQYILTYTFPNSSFVTTYINTKPLTVNLTVTPTSSTVKVEIVFNVPFNVTMCAFRLYKAGKLFLECSLDCGSCSNYLFHGLTPNTEYTAEYWNSYLYSSENKTFATKYSIFNVALHPGYTDASIEISSNMQYYSNCNAKLFIYPTEPAYFDCTNTPGCSTCGKFSITGLKPDVGYILAYTFDNRKEIRDIYFKTYHSLLQQKFLQTQVNLIHAVVYNFHSIPHDFHCTITIVSDHAKCRLPCPTNCSSYYIEITNLDDFNVTLSSPEAPKSHAARLSPVPYKIHITSHYVDGHTLNVVFTPNLKGAGNCTLKVFSMDNEVFYNCTDEKCPTNCDELSYSLGNIDINSQITFEINNKHMKEPIRLDLNLMSEITIDEYIETTVSTANVTIYHGGRCCCNASVINPNTGKILVDNCQNNQACRNCSSFAFKNLIANSNYLLKFTLPDGRILDRSFRTKPETIKVETFSGNTEIDITITSNVRMEPQDCSFALINDQNYRISSCYSASYYYSTHCQSCYENHFYGLIPGSKYKLIFKSIYLKNPYETYIRTEPLKVNATISSESSYNHINISLNLDSSTSEECDVKVIDVNTNKKIPFSCLYTDTCRKCNNFTIKNLKPLVIYAIIVKFLNSDSDISRRVSTKYIYLYQYPSQTHVSEISVRVEIFGYSFKSYHCTIQITGSSASCSICPTNCSSYTLIISSIDPFNVTLDSDMASRPISKRVIPATYVMSYEYSTYDGVVLLCKFVPNLIGAGMCTIEGFDGKDKIDIRCDNSLCVKDCDNMTISITGINYNANFSLKISNSYLLRPAIFPLKLERNINVVKKISTTSTTASIDVIGGNVCCCKASIKSYTPSTYTDNYCKLDQDCESCQSFYLEGLLPNTYYYLTFETPSGVEIYRDFRTDYLDFKFVNYISFTSAEITIENELAHDISPSMCSIALTLRKKTISSCYGNCLNCTFIVFSNLEPNTSYEIYYYNYASIGSTYYSFVTLDSVGIFPELSDAVQLDYRNIYMTINNETLHNYLGTYDIYAVENETIEFHVSVQAPLIKGLFEKNVESLTVPLDFHFEIYMIVMCFDIAHEKCKQNPDEYYCLICYERKLKVCSEMLLHYSTGNFSLNAERIEMTISHTLKALTCHETLSCYVTFVYLLRKYVSVTSLDHYPERKTYYLSGMGINYILHLNDTECRTEQFVISSKNSFSGKPFISFTGVFYTVSFVTCNSISCFPSRLYDNIYVPTEQFGDIIVFVILLLISIGFLVTSVVIIYKYSPESISKQDELNARNPSTTVLSEDNLTAEGEHTKDTAALKFALSA